MRIRISLLLILMILGCDREPVVTVAASPATAPAQAAAISSPATLPSNGVIWIDQKPYEFPAAVLTIRRPDGDLLLELTTDNPPQAKNEDYTGNSFFLSMPIDAPAEGSSIAGATWRFRASNTERADTVAGIYLRGEHRLLQPFDATATVMGADSPVVVAISGTFLMFDEQDDTSSARKVAIMAELPAAVRSREQPAVAPATRPARGPIRP